MTMSQMCHLWETGDGLHSLATLSERPNMQANNGQTMCDSKALTHSLCSSHLRSQPTTSAAIGQG